MSWPHWHPSDGGFDGDSDRVSTATTKSGGVGDEPNYGVSQNDWAFSQGGSTVAMDGAVALIRRTVVENHYAPALLSEGSREFVSKSD